MLFPNLSFHFQFIKKNENVEILEVMKKIVLREKAKISIVSHNNDVWIKPQVSTTVGQRIPMHKCRGTKMLVRTAKRELSKIDYHIHTDAVECI